MHYIKAKHVLLASNYYSFLKKSHIHSLSIFSFLFLFYHFLVLHMDASKPQPAMKLKEHLQQHQEPFSLQNYLNERSYMFKNCNTDCNSSTHSLYSTKNLKRLIKYDLHKTRKRSLHATGILRSTLYKYIPTVDDNQDFSSYDEEHNSDGGYYVHEIMTDTKATQQTDETFSLKRLAVSDHFTDLDVEDRVLPFENHNSSLENMFQTFTIQKFRGSEVDAGTKPYWISSKENQQQYNRGSECKEPLSHAVCHLQCPEPPVTPLQTLSQNAVLSTYLRKLLVNSNILKFRRTRKDKVEGTVETASLCLRNRRILQKRRKQLQFECVTKDRVFQKNEGRSLSLKEVSEHEHFSFLEKHCREVRKITHLLHKEPSVISEEWKRFEIVNWKILAEIGDSIMDDIVTEIIYLF